MPKVPYYETDRAASEYLLLHYGTKWLPEGIASEAALNFPARCVSQCLDAANLPGAARALDLGCAVGRSTFELASVCQEVIGIDYSKSFVSIAENLRRRGSLKFQIATEGDLTIPATAKVPSGINRSRLRFEQGDATKLRNGLGQFDVVLMANLIDRLYDPRRCLEQMGGLVKAGGRLVITSPYTWLEEYTPRRNWLGGFVRNGRSVSTLQGLTDALRPWFVRESRRDLPFLIREHARKFQLGIAEATVWRRRR